MNRFSCGLIVGGAIAIFAICGCGGGGNGNNVTQGALSGIVFDINGNPVRGATVSTHDKFGASTTSNSNGSYILNTVQGQDGTVYATLTAGGVTYLGQNFFQVFQGSQTKSVNITVAPQNTLATMSGTVFDRQGNTITGAQVFAVSANGYSSATTLTDNNGNYTLPDLMPGITYTVQGTGQGYSSDQTTENFSNSQNLNVNFTLSDATGAQINAPTGVVATAYTSPAEPTRSKDYASAIENMKRITNPAYAKAVKSGHVGTSQTRTTPNGNLTEIDVVWTPASDPELLGWGIYNTVGTGNPNNLVDYYQDPLADLYADLEPSLQVGQTYTYGVTSINTSFGQSGGNESVLSNTSTCTVVGDLILLPTDPTTPTFNWNAASGCTQYVVYLFDQYPSIGVTSIFDNSANPTTGTSLTYNSAGGLVSGSTYYFIVVGSDAAGDGKSFSPVGSFVKS